MMDAAALLLECSETPTKPEVLDDTSLFARTKGPRDADILFVGEAFGAEEAHASLPFVGHSGKELDRILHDAGLGDSKILFTNCINARPPGNDFTHYLFESRAKGCPAWNGAKLKSELTDGIEKLFLLIARVRPRLIIAAGNWPLFVLTEHVELKTTKGYKLPTGIAKWRGSQTWSREIDDSGRASSSGLETQRTKSRYPVLPIIHPAAILREWGWRNVTVHDLKARAKRFLDGKTTWEEKPSFKRSHKPTWEDVQKFFRSMHLQLGAGPVWLSVDLETFKRRWISVIGLANAEWDLVIPLFLRGADNKLQNYWSLWQEQAIFRDLKTILEHPNVRIIGQNFIYDTEYLHRYYNIRALVSFDTMVAHHLLFPGTPKRLDYLASLYNNHYVYWKDEREDWDQLPEDAERYWLYNAKDIRATFESAMVLQSAIKQQGLEALLEERLEQWVLSREMSLRGIMFNLTLQQEMKLDLLTEASSLQQWLLNAIPDSLQFASSGKPWYDSPTQTAYLFYTILKIAPVLHKKTKRPTTDDAALAELSERPEARWLEPLLARLRHLRSLGVFTRNFLSARVSADGRMRCTFNVAHPETFRWSSNKNGFGEGLNGQNIPKGDKDYDSEGLDETAETMDDLEEAASPEEL